MHGKFNKFSFSALIKFFLLLFLACNLAACGEATTTVFSLAPTNPPTITSLDPTALPTTTLAPASPTALPRPTFAPTTSAPTTTSLPVITPTAAPSAINAPTILATSPTVPVTVAAPTAPDFSGDLAMTHVTHLAGVIGPRVAGTEAERKAGDYIENHFRQLGLTVSRPAFQISTSLDKGSQLSFKDSSKQTVEIKGSAFNMSANGKVNAPLVFANYGRKTDIPVGGLQGRIALVERGEIPFEDKVSNVTQAGAVGIVVYNNLADQPLKGTLGTQATIPALGITKADGAKLRDELLAQTTYPLNLEVNITNQSVDMTNVVGIRPAADSATASPILILGGHYDSVPDSPGANDNASGTATVMELARVLKDRYPQYELRFIAFAGEEIGLTGSANYAKNLSSAEKSRLKAMINIDMITVGDTLLLGGEASLVRLAQTAALDLGAGNVQVMPAAALGGSDNYSFQQVGIPTLFFNRENDPNYHRFSDSVDKVKPERLELVGRSVIKVIDALTRT